MVNQITTNLMRIHGLGVKKIAVTGIGPLGCLPLVTAPSSFRQCNDTFNTLITLHDTLLNQAVAKLNQEAKDHSTFVVLDLYDTFMSILNQPWTHNFVQNPLRPCCLGVSSEYMCGDVDANKVKKYRVCDDPKSAFFWDIAHPAQAGWSAVYNKLRTTNALQHLQF